MAVLLHAVPGAARDPVKCGHAIVRRAERLLPHGGAFLVPRGCARVRWPESYGTLKLDNGWVDLYRDGTRVARFPGAPKTRPVAQDETGDALRAAGLAVYELN